MKTTPRFQTVWRRPRRRPRPDRPLRINLRLAMSSGWSISAHHGTSRDERHGVRYEHWERSAFGEAKRHEYEARYREIPEDTRDLTGRILGDPLPDRSALARKRRGL